MRAHAVVALLLTLLTGVCVPATVVFEASASNSLEDITYPCSLSLGDLNGDGRADLAVASRAPLPQGGFDKSLSRVLVFFQKEGAVFSQPPDKSVAIESPAVLAIGDFDEDGTGDLAVTTGRRNFYLLPGSGGLDVVLHSYDVNHGMGFLHSGRLNSEGHHDFLCGPSWRKWLGLGGDKEFRTGYFSGPEANDNLMSVVADLNGDGASDVLFTTRGPELRIYYGPLMHMSVRPADLATFLVIPTPAAVRHAAVGDLNGDGRPDIVASVRDQGANLNRIIIYYQETPTGFSPEAPVSAHIEGLSALPMVLDLTGNRLDDLLVADSQARKVYVFEQSSGQPFATDVSETTQVLNTPCNSITLGDISGNGLPDLVVGDIRNNTVRIHMNVGTPPDAVTPEARPPQPTAVAQQPAAPKVPPTGPRTPEYVPYEPAFEFTPYRVTVDPNSTIGKVAPAHDPFMIPFYTGTILPTPQQVEYHEQFLPLEQVGLILGEGLEPTDPRLEVLTQRIRRYGGTSNSVTDLSGDYETFILVGDSPLASDLLNDLSVPDRPQGYLIHCTTTEGRNVVILQGRDDQGLLWAISSLIQLIHQREGRTVVQAAEVLDYPEAPRRGFLSSAWRMGSLSGAWFAVRFKFNNISFNASFCPGDRQLRRKWREERPEYVREDIRHIGEYLTPLGIEWVAGIRTLSYPDPNEQLRCGSDEDLEIVLKLAEIPAQVGGGFSIKFDDIRFPLHPDDQERFGSAREADIYFLNSLYNSLQERYPGIRLVFCPPFYWGPRSSYTYPESRDEYLYAIGSRLPEDMDIFWTGPSVKSAAITREQVEWITERIERKPLFWQNKFGSPHVYGYHYTTDPLTHLPEWYYDGFIHDIDTYMPNGGGATTATALVSIADYFWNPHAFDAERSIRDATMKLAGPESYEPLVEVNRLLSYFDQFSNRVTPGAALHHQEIERKIAELERACNAAMEHHPAAVWAWTGTVNHHLVVAQRFVDRLSRSSSLAAYAQQAEVSRQQAEREVALDPETDAFLSAGDFVGGRGPSLYSHLCEQRLATWIYGVHTGNSALTSQFTVDPFPPSGDYLLIMSAQDDETDNRCRIRIEVNDQQIFEGPNPFQQRGWSLESWTIPADALARQNRLVIRNIEDSSNSVGPPWFMVNYAVVRKTQ